MVQARLVLSWRARTQVVDGANVQVCALGSSATLFFHEESHRVMERCPTRLQNTWDLVLACVWKLT